MKHTNRRQFLKDTAKASAAVWAAYAFTAETTKAQESRNDRPRVGVIGLGGMGQTDAGFAAEYGDIVALCDGQVGEHRLDVAPTRAKNGPQEFNSRDKSQNTEKTL